MSTVWIVDDSAVEMEIARRALHEEHELGFFPDGTTMLEKVSHGAPDVLVLDWQLPGMTGIEICRFLRTREATLQLPILILSGTHSSARDIVEGLEAGANDYVVKPYSAIELSARVASLVRQRRLRERAEAAERSLQGVLRNLPDALLATDVDGRIRFANRMAEELFAEIVPALLGESLATVVPALARVDLRAPGSSSSNDPLPDVQLGDRVFSPALGRVVMGEDGESVTITFRDVTDKVQAIEQRDRFMAMLGHELRNPLAPILSATQLIQLKPGDAEAASRAAGIAHRQASRLTRIVDDLLDVSRLNRGRIEIHPEPVNVASAVQRAVETLQPFLDTRNHTLTLSVPPALWVNADVVRFDQILTNLVHNAAKYTEPHGQLSVSAEPDGRQVVISVRDSGLGIRKDMLEAIFDMFVQVDDSLHRPQGGLGIGLALVKQLAEIHGGSIEAKSAGVGRGSEFRLHLPSARSTSVQPAPPARQAPQRKLRVLLVDDNQDAVELLSEAIALAGHDVRVAHEGHAALELARSFAPEVVLLDIGLPNVDGYEVARRLRAELQLDDALLVALTGYGQPEDIERATRAGFDKHFVKPVSIEMVDQLLARR